jgi:hypothetical protein
MTDDQRDPAAELRARLEAFVEAFQSAATALGRAVTAWAEQNRPALDLLGRLAQDPRVLAYIEARKRGEIPPSPGPCHCLCARTHPDDRGVCDMEAVTTRHYDTQMLGPVDVALCAPCAAAQFLAEVTGA